MKDVISIYGHFRRDLEILWIIAFHFNTISNVLINNILFLSLSSVCVVFTNTLVHFHYSR